VIREFPRGRAIVPFAFAFFLFGAAPGNPPNPEDWSTSPEAYFLTAEERAEWKALDSRDSRDRFIERYWLKRDPTSGTDKNEFRETVLARIKTADQRFGIEKTPGSRTARGLVFIVLGSPSRVQDQYSPRPAAEASPSQRMGVLSTPVASTEGNETTSTWYYEADRSKRILEVIHMPSFQVRIVVEPSRHTDAIQSPGLFDQVRETVARASIVNPDLIPPAKAAGPPLAAAPPRQAMTPAVQKILETAATSPSLEAARAGSAVVFRDGDPETLLWVFTSRPAKRMFFHAIVRDTPGHEVASVTGPAETSSAFSTHSPGMVAMRKLALPPGSYSASVALTGEDEKLLAAASLPLQVPALDSGFAVSSLLLTRGPATGSGGGEEFTFAGTVLPPRADGLFTPSESVWYFVEVANPTDESKVLLEPRLRRGGQPMAGLPPFAAKLQPIGAKRYIAGVEIPLATLDAGDYVLYVTVRDGEGEERPHAVRRADFQIVR